MRWTPSHARARRVPTGSMAQSLAAGIIPRLRSGRSELNCTAVMQRTPRIEIEYCTQCRWLLRAAWMAQELLTTFSTEIGELALVPGTGGVLEIRIGDDTVWSRAEK